MKALLRILFILLPFLWSIVALAQPGQDRDCSSTCFSTEVVSAERISDHCTAFEMRVSWSGDCAHALSHFSVAIPCGEISDLSNSENWNHEIGSDPTTGLTGFKIDDIQEFGKNSLNEFRVKFKLCSSSEECASILKCWQPVVAYKAATCVNFQTLDLACTSLKASLEKKDVSCFGANDGVLTVTIEEGVEPFIYAWSTGATGSSASALSAGHYSVSVKDASGSELILEETIVQPAEILVSAASTVATCSGINDAAIDLTVSGGSGAYTYQWSTGAVSEDLTGISPGPYKVLVTDSDGCTVEETYEIAGDSEIIISADQTPPLCSASNGAIDITVSGGSDPYTYEWSTGETTEDIVNLAAGVYELTVRSGNCSQNKTFILTPNNPLKLSFLANASDCDEPNGSIDLTIEGGSSPYVIEWNNGETTEDISGLSGGVYSATVRDVNGCTKTIEASVMEKTFTVSGNVVNLSCTGENDGSITLGEPVGGEPPYAYEWSNGSTSSAITGLGTGIYSVTVTDAGGCKAQQFFVVGMTPVITASASVTNMNCGEEGNYAIDLDVSGGVGPFTFSWSDGSTSEDREQLNAGSYTVKITDSKGCSIEKEVTVEQTDQWSCSIQALPGEPLCGSTGNILQTAIGDADSYLWSVESSDTGWKIESGSSESSVYFSAGSEGSSATFTLTVTMDGCVQSCSYAVTTCTVDNDEGEDPGDGPEDDPEEDPDDEEDTSDSESCEECFSTTITLVESNNSCNTYEVVVSTNGRCRHELSHWSIAIPCGKISDMRNSHGWKMEIGTDPTTGISGFKVDDIGGFGRTESSFTVRFQVCYEGSCYASAWEPIVAYKAGQCVGYQALPGADHLASTMSVQSYPNPFREKINFEWVAAEDDYGTLQILDQFGHTIDVLFSGSLQQGSNYSVEWSGEDVNTGIYYYKLVTSRKSYHGKIFRK